MNKKLRDVNIGVAAYLCTATIAARVLEKRAEKTTYTAEAIEPVEPRKQGFYEKYIKRAADVVCASAAITVFAPLYAGVAIAVKKNLGSPVLFTQERPGMIGPDGKERIFKMYKFRSMTDERDKKGNLLPDEVRLTKFGKWLRSTSLDELPEAFNILNGTMSVIGPRPWLVKYLPLYTDEQRHRHYVRPGLSGWAQVNGRNTASWEDRLKLDLWYVNNVSLMTDIKIVFLSVLTALKREGISSETSATMEEFKGNLNEK